MDAVPSPPPSSSLSTMNGGVPGGREYGVALSVPRLPNELDIRAVSPRRPSREDARYPTQGVRLSSPSSTRASVPELAPLRTSHPSHSGSMYSSPASARPLDSDAYHTYPSEHEYSNPHTHYPTQGFAAPYTTSAQQTHVSQGYSHHQPPNPSVYPPPMPSPPSEQTTVPSTPVGATPYASQFQIQLPPPPPHLGQYGTNGPARSSSGSTSASLPNIAPYPYYGGTSGVRASVACDACRKRKVKCSVLMSQQQNYQRSNAASGVVMNDPYAPPSTLSPSEERRGSIMLQEPPPKVCVRCARLGINCTWKDDREREATKKPSSSALSSAAASGRAASKARKEKDSGASSSAAGAKMHEGQMTFDSGSYAPHPSGAPSSQQQSYGYPHPISPSASTSTSNSGSHTSMSVSTSSISGNSTSTVATSPSPPGSGGLVGNGYFVVDDVLQRQQLSYNPSPHHAAQQQPYPAYQPSSHTPPHSAGPHYSQSDVQLQYSPSFHSSSHYAPQPHQIPPREEMSYDYVQGRGHPQLYLMQQQQHQHPPHQHPQDGAGYADQGYNYDYRRGSTDSTAGSAYPPSAGTARQYHDEGYHAYQHLQYPPPASYDQQQHQPHDPYQAPVGEPTYGAQSQPQQPSPYEHEGTYYAPR